MSDADTTADRLVALAQAADELFMRVPSLNSVEATGLLALIVRDIAMAASRIAS